MAIEDITDVKPGDYYEKVDENNQERALYRVICVRKHPTVTLERIYPKPGLATEDLPQLIEGTLGDEKFRNYIKLWRRDAN